jgi:hypothetical protein
MKHRISGFFTTATLAVFLCAGTAFAQTSAPIHDHSFYSGVCCNGNDCEPITDNAVRETESGFVIEYKSVHGMFVKGFIKRGLEKQSPDGRNHACRMPNGVRCLYRALPTM